MRRESGLNSGEPALAVRRVPAAPAAVFFLAGIVLHPFLPPAHVLGLIGLAVLIALSVMLRRRCLLATTTVCAAWGVAGLLAASLAAYRYTGDHIGHFASDTSRLAQLELALDDPPRIVTNPFDQRRAMPPKQTALARVVRVHTHAGWVDATGEVLLQIAEPKPELAAGQTIRATGMLQRPAPAMNPGQFDWAAYYRERRVLASFGVGQAASIRVLADPGPGRLASARLKVRELLASGFPPERELDHALIRALLLGDNDPQLRDVQDQFQQTGTAHHLAISGTHIAVLGGLLWLLLRVFAARPRVAAFVVMVFVIGYGAMALPSPPVVRSVVLAAAFCLGAIQRRAGNAAQLLAVSVLAMLVYHPLDLFNAGFQLSFGTVLGLILFARPTMRAMETARGWNDPDEIVRRSFEHPSAARRAWEFVNRMLMEAMAAGLVAWLVSMPLIAWHFEQLNPWAIVAGILLAPIVVLALVGGLAKVVLTLLWPWQASAWAWLAIYPIEWMREIVEWLAGWSYADIPVPRSPWWLIAIFYVLMLTALWRSKPSAFSWIFRVARLVALAYIVMPQLQAHVNPPVPDGTTRVTLLAVGAGQCAVVQPPGGRTVLVDAGSASLSDPIGKCIGPFLRHARSTGVDTLLLSHADADHVSAAAEICRSYRVREVLTGARFSGHGGDHVGRLLRDFNRAERPPRLLLPGQENPLGRDTTIDVLWPPAADVPTPGVKATNDGSLVFRLTHAGRSILFPGDIQNGAMRQLLLNPEKLKADVLVAMHHGSAESLSAEFIAAVNPTYVVASNDRTLTAKQRAFDRLCEGRTLLRTHTSGAITITMGRDGTLAVEPFLKTKPAERP